LNRYSYLTRYWFEFDFAEEERHPVLQLGVGVTAFDYEDAVSLVRDRVFDGAELLRIQQVTENVDVSTLDPGHVLPNMAPPDSRGIWFPMGFT
jgi:hypothetical protein